MLPMISPAGERFVDTVNTIQAKLNIDQQQIATGLKVNQASDAPDQISPILQLHSDIQQNSDIQTGLNSAQAELQAADGALSSSVDLLQSASVIASQATSTDQTAATRATMAQSVQSLLSQMVSNSQTALEGRYIFSGDQDQKPLYQLDSNAAGGVDRLQVAAATKEVRGPNGSTFPVALSGNAIFDHRNPDDTPAPDNVFAALNNLSVALQANDTTGIQNSITSLQSASTYLNGQLAFYGQAENRVTTALTQTGSRDVSLRSELSGMTDADLTQSITALTEGQTQLQAALSARARMPQTSLFDVLPQP
jgi:flagellar hook-associated protein 3 FlgL